MTRRAALLLLSQALPVDPKVILDQSVTLDISNYQKLRGYVWNSEEQSFVNGKLSRQQSYEINLVSGAMYWRKLADNGEPLTGKEAAAESERLQRHLRSPVTNLNWRVERDHLELLPHSHRVKYLGEDQINGRPNHLIETQPLPGRHAPLLAAFRYKLWIDKAELHWTRAEITVIRKVEWLLHQLAVGRISYPYSNNIVNTGQLKPGASRTMETERLADGVWTLSTVETHSGNFVNRLRYFNYRRFSSESQLLP